MAPNSIILDTRALMTKVRFHAHNVNEIQGRVFVNDLIEDVVDCISNNYEAIFRLTELAKEIYNGEYQYGYTILNPDLAPALYNLGASMHEQLRHFGIYLPDGSLRYHHYRIEDPHFNDIVLARTYELTQNSDASNLRSDVYPKSSAYP